MLQDFSRHFKPSTIKIGLPASGLAAKPLQDAGKGPAGTDRMPSLMHVNDQIRAASNVEQIVDALSQPICKLFDCERIVLYLACGDHLVTASVRGAGPGVAPDARLPISESSVAGCVALHRRIVSIGEPADQAQAALLREMEMRSSLRVRQVLAAPILDAQGMALLGVIELVNHRSGGPFDSVDALTALCASVATVLAPGLKGMARPRSKYHCLIDDEVLSGRDFELATHAAERAGSDIEQVLLNEFHVKLSLIGAALGSFFGVPYEPFRSDRIKPIALLKNVKREFAEHNGWLLIDGDQDGLAILALDPDQLKNSRAVNNVFPKARLLYRVTTNREFQLTVDQFFGIAGDAGSVDDLLLNMKGGDEEADPAVDVSAAVENELVKLVNQILVDAYRQGASDIHIEPGSGREKTLIRFRKDGSLEPYIEIPAIYRNALLVRIKIMCELDISEHRKPQDGKIKFRKYGPLDIELRVVCIPSSGGVEDVVMRILSAGEPMPMEQLGILPHNLRRLKMVIEKPYGLFFVCGPTGSGKTTTLHSVLSHLNTLDRKIWTAEDPVEITQKGLRQVQVNRKTGLDFATVIRSFLRADPDIIMVGEMRDKETVSIGLEASLTGHLVLSTLHTNSAPESVVRLLDMGMDPFNFADALLGVLAQRLVKRLCLHCRKPHLASAIEIEDMLTEYCQEMQHGDGAIGDATEQVRKAWVALYADRSGAFTLYQAFGCERCSKGYKGRVGLHELMVGTDKVKQLIQEHAHMAQLQAAAIEDGMLTLKMDGIEKVLSGTVDMKQVRLACIR
jgi:type II secretory ATPase GspE/PulE/Tfp pilus assembly ATPase PilB-like protein